MQEDVLVCDSALFVCVTTGLVQYIDNYADESALV